MKIFTHTWGGLLIVATLSAPVQAAEAATPPVGATVVMPAWGCTADNVPVLDPTNPRFLAGDLGAYTSSSQPVVDCFAWQTFAALQWPVDSGWPDDPDMAGEPDRQFQAADWGVPVDPLGSESRPRVWETFKPVQDIFLANGAKPTAWGVSSPAPGTCGNATGAAGMGRQLNSLSKVPSGGIQARLAASVVNPDETNEAMGGWLTDQAGELVWFERLVSRAEFEYIVDNQLYLASRQKVIASNQDGKHSHGLSLPTGQPPQGQVQSWQDRGAMEIKVAWRNLSDHQELWPRYHTAKAWLTNLKTGDCQQAVMGMVGFHFILKSEHFPNFMWATFEHIDNVPTPSAGYTHPSGFSFYDPQCNGDDSPRCKPNQPRVDCDKKGNCKPLYPKTQPVQVERLYPIPPETTQLNLAMQDKIAKVTEGKSVFQYYQLINTQWAQSPVGPYTAPGKTIPLKVSSMTSGGSQPVANVTMETYVQNKTCTDCHKNATIAADSELASDFSFIFFRAASSTEPGGE